MIDKNRKKNEKIIYLSKNENETKKLGKSLSKYLKREDVVAFNGDLGAGKTCFIQGIAEGLNCKNYVSSPSFSIIKEYSCDLTIYHFDLYRLGRPEELEDLGYEEYFYGNGITLIEWAIKIIDYLPKNILLVEIKIGEEYSTRKIIFKPFGKRYEKIMEELKNCENIGN